MNEFEQSSELSEIQKQLIAHLDELLESGRNAVDNGEPYLALAFYDMLLLLYPDEPVALTERGEIYTSIGNYKRAFADISRAIELSPDFEYAADALAQLHRLAESDDST